MVGTLGFWKTIDTGYQETGLEGDTTMYRHISYNTLAI